MWKQDSKRAQNQHDQDHSLAIADLVPLHDLDVPDGITSIGRTIVIKGEVRSGEHLIIKGQVEGQVAVPNHGLAVGQSGVVGPEVFARTITIRGTAVGNLTAIETLEILETGNVEGRLVARRIAIDEGATFNGVVDPKLADVAIAVGRHRLTQPTDPAKS